MRVAERIEGFLGWALYNFKGHDNDLIFNKPPFVDVPETIKIISEDIKDGEIMPFFTVSSMINGGDQSPAFKLTNLPAETNSIAILLQDPDCPPFNATHFISYNIKPDNTDYPRGYFNIPNEEADLKHGFGVMGKQGYHGARPPIAHGPHRYFFVAYAIDKEGTDALETLTSPPKINQFTDIIAGHAIAYGKIAPFYER